LPVLSDYTAFRASLAKPDALIERAGRYTLPTALRPTHEEVDKLTSDIDAYLEARDFWHNQAAAWEAQYRRAAGLEPE